MKRIFVVSKGFEGIGGAIKQIRSGGKGGG